MSRLSLSSLPFAPISSILIPAILQVYTYEGRAIAAPKFQGMRPDALNSSTVSMGSDCIAVIDHQVENEPTRLSAVCRGLLNVYLRGGSLTLVMSPFSPQDAKTVRIFDSASGKEIGKPISHILDVVGVQVNRWGSGSHRKCIMIDRNRDLYVVPVGQAAGGKEQAPYKLGTMCDSAVWNTGECFRHLSLSPSIWRMLVGTQVHARLHRKMPTRIHAFIHMRTCTHTYTHTIYTFGLGMNTRAHIC